MSKEQFETLFDRALETAAEEAAQRLQRPVPRRFEIEMHGLGEHSQLISKDGALDLLYLGPDLFYRIIDISVISVSDNVVRIFLCVSGHQPGSFEETWNQPPGTGPFKQLHPQHIAIV